MNYNQFLKTKQIKNIKAGFDISIDELNPRLFNWQKLIVRWSLKKGKCCLFEDCGLGKTLQQLEFAYQVNKHTNKPVLIISPLAVAEQTQREGRKFGYEVNIFREQSDIINGINITNYDIVNHFDSDAFSGVVLDESSIIKSYNGHTKQLLVDKFINTPFKLCCTATPSPNDFTELGNHAEFLGIMSRTEMLATFFIHDGGSTKDWRLKGHAKEKFFEWVAQWACCLNNPKEIGFDGSNYTLPDLTYIQHIVKSDKLEDDNGQLMMLPQTNLTLSERRKARKDSIKKRIELAAQIANSYNGQSLIWVDYNDESTLATELIKGAVEVKGSDIAEHKAKAMLSFADGQVRCLVSKPKIAGWGMNWQNCNNIIFAGLSDSFESFYQAVRRCYRFGQLKDVTVHIIVSDAEETVKNNIERKQAQAEKLKTELVKYTKDILNAEIHSTVKITEKYYATKILEVPEWVS